jgi:hypothetical protein
MKENCPDCGGEMAEVGARGTVRLFKCPDCGMDLVLPILSPASNEDIDSDKAE